MAKHFSLQLLLLSALITAANLHLISAADTPPPSRATTPPSNHPPPSPPKPSKPRHRHSHHRHRGTPPLSSAGTPHSNPPISPSPKPSKRRHRHSHHRHRKTPPIPPASPSSQTPPPLQETPPIPTDPTSQTPPPHRETPPPPSAPISQTPPPPPPTPPEIQENPLSPLRNIIDGLIGSSDFLGWNKGITSTDVPLEATFFVPNNNAILNPGGVDFGPSAILYHIVPQRLTFSDLKKLPLKARLPTLLPNKYIVITSNSPSTFTVDDSQIVLPDIFSNAAFVIHSVGKILDSSVYGGDGILLPPLENTTTPSRPPLRKTPEHSPEMTSGGRKYYHCNGLLMVFLTLRYAQLLKIVPVITRFY